MKKIALGISLLIFTTIVGIIAFSCVEKPFDVLVSPNGKYKVELYGDKGSPWFFDNTVTAKIFDDEKFLANEELHSGDFFDSSFEMTYQKYIWVDDNILSFRGVENHQVANDKNGDSLRISNDTDQEIRFLKIGLSVNIFLVLNLAPHSSKTVYVNHSKAQQYIYARGEFADGQKTAFSGVNFTEQSKKRVNEFFKYCISVEGNNILINSHQVEGYETNPKIIIAKAENCSQ